MTQFLPPPDPKASDSNARHRKRGPKSKNADIPSIDELLGMLMKLNRLVVLKVISTAQANTIQRSLRTMLDIQMKRTQGQPHELPQEALADLCRSDPSILNLLEPFLPDELVERLMEEVKDDNDQT
jgi:hypothetical protein